MKKIILATLAAASLVACAKENVVATYNEAIAFDNTFVNNTTKSIDPSITTANLQGFLVYGTTKGDHTNAETINIFNAVPVGHNIQEGVSTGWQYAAGFTQYWIAGNKYNFAAVVNYDGTGNLDKTKVSTDAYGMPTEIVYAANGIDLLYARSAEDIVGLVSGNPKVAFTFDHLLSKVKFSFKNTTPASDDTNKYTYRVSNIVMTGTPAEGTCNVTGYPTYAWSVAADVASATTNYGHIVANGTTVNEDATPVGPSTIKYSNNENLVIPGEYEVNIKCQIELLISKEVDGETIYQVADIISYDKNTEVTLEQGVAYNFVLSGKLGEAIAFTVTKVNAWDIPEQVTTPAM